MRWRAVLNARSLVGAFAAAEACSFAAHQYRLHDMESAPRRAMEGGFDYDGHYVWFARELRHEPNPRRLFHDAFNGRLPLEAIPRECAVHMLQFYLTGREREEFPDGAYPPDVVRESEALLKALEKRHGLSFSSAHTASTTPPTSAKTEFLLDGGGGSQGGLPGMSAELAEDVDFIRTNKFDLTPFYKPIVLQLLIYATRELATQRLRAAGFTRRRDEATDVVLWVRPPAALDDTGGVSARVEGGEAGGNGSNDVPTDERDAERHNPIVFLHGLGLGIAPYAEYVAALPSDRLVIAPEWPNISYGADRGHRYPTPSQLADFLHDATKRVSEELKATEAAGGDGRATPSGARAGVPVQCDVIAHSYGTVVLTYFRRHHPKAVRRTVYVDPVCFLPSFGSYLRYAHDDHLMSWRDLLDHLADRGSDPTEKMSMFNLVLASWFIKGDASTQQLMKRLLFPHEAWERGPLGDDAMIVLSGLDDIVASEEIHARFTRAWPRCNIVMQRQWQHGGFLLEPDPEGVNERIFQFVAGDRKPVVTPRGVVKRAWRLVFAKRKRKASDSKAGDEGETIAAAPVTPN